MIYYRLSLLIIISLSSLGFAPNSYANLLSLEPFEPNRKVEIIAQGTSPNSTNSEPSAYDKYMREGYKATKEQDYQTAKEKFTQALEARPNDIYAEQALQNVNVYLTKQTNVFSSNGIWWLLGLIIIIGGIGVTFWLFLRRPSVYAEEQFEEGLLTSEKDQEYPKSKETEKEPLHFTPPTTPKNNDLNTKNSSVDESALAVQQTTRLPKKDSVERLIDDLQEADPKKRRKAIWQLAQTADSRAMKPLVDLMIDTDSQERSLILEALSQISVRTLKPMNQALAISLQDKNPQVRKNAIRDLTRIYELMSQISQLLYHAIDDNDQEVKKTAKWAINQLNTQVPPSLDHLNRDSNSEVIIEQSYADSPEDIL